MELERGDFGVEFGVQGAQGDSDEGGEGKVVANGIDFEAGDKVGLGVGRESGNIADSGVYVADEDIDGCWLEVLNIYDARFGLFKVASEGLFKPDAARAEDVLVEVPCSVAALDDDIREKTALKEPGSELVCVPSQKVLRRHAMAACQ